MTDGIGNRICLEGWLTTRVTEAEKCLLAWARSTEKGLLQHALDETARHQAVR